MMLGEGIRLVVCCTSHSSAQQRNEKPDVYAAVLMETIRRCAAGAPDIAHPRVFAPLISSVSQSCARAECVCQSTGKSFNFHDAPSFFFFPGCIPPELGQLFSLELLILNDNRLIGERDGRWTGP